jgi:hypothetical protein
LTSRLQNLSQDDAIALVDSDGMLLSWSRILMRRATNMPRLSMTFVCR